MKRNLIFAWPPMWKSDFHMTPHVEIIENAAIWQFFDERTIFLEKTRQIEAWNRNIAWLTPTGIQFPNGPWVSGMNIFSSQGLKKPPKISPREEKLSSQGPQGENAMLIANWDLKILDSDYIQKINFKFKLWSSQPTELSGLAITNFNQTYPILSSETILN